MVWDIIIIPIEFHIFQRGWWLNHQPAIEYVKKMVRNHGIFPWDRQVEFIDSTGTAVPIRNLGGKDMGLVDQWISEYNSKDT